MDVTSNHLTYYLNRIYKFLTSDVKSQIYVSLTMGMENILVNIVTDVNYLKNERFDDDCKSIAEQITAVLELNKDVFSLNYEFDNDEHGRKIMVYKKIPVLKNSLGLELLRKPHNIQPTPNTSDKSKTKTVMSGFKTSCLNATLKFVKNDLQLLLQYPDMSTEQEEFIKQMISQCMSPKDNTTPGTGFKGLYDPLAEALRIFSLKYEFQLSNEVPMHKDMKRLLFKKIPKANNNQEIIDLYKKPDKSISVQKNPLPICTDLKPEPKKNLKILEITKNKDAETLRKLDISLKNQEKTPERCKVKTENTIENPTFDEMKENSTDFNKNTEFSKNISKENKADFIVKRDYSTVAHSKKKKKLFRELISRIIDLKSSFAEEAITQLKDFLANSAQKDLIYTNLSSQEMDFLVNWEMVVQRLEIVQMFNLKGRMLMHDICTLVTQGSAKYRVKVFWETLPTMERSVTFMKYPKQSLQEKVTQEIDTHKYEDVISISSSSTSLSTSSENIPNHKKVEKFFIKTKSLTEKWIKTSLSKLTDFLNDDTQASLVIPGITEPQMVFLKEWRKMLSESVVIESFSPEIQYILADLKHSSFQMPLKYIVDTKVSKNPIRDFTFTKVPYCPNEQTEVSVAAKIPPKVDGKKTELHETTKNLGRISKNEPKANGSKVKKLDGAMLSDHNTSLSSTSSGQSIPKQSKKVKEFFTKIKPLTAPWIKSSLSKLNDFLNDESQASFIIKSITEPQMLFLMKWEAMLGKMAIIEGFPPEIQKLLTGLNRCRFQNALRYTVEVKVTLKQSRDITFTKIPSFPNTQTEATKLKENVTATTPKVHVNKAEHGKTKQSKPESSKPKNDKNKIVNPLSAKIMSIPKSSSTTSLPAKKSRAVDNKERPYSASGKQTLNKAKAKLIEGLSQPLVSEKGIKMMRNMGWEGGALGARGEGIVEPIALQLDMGKRAGLGSIKAANPPKQGQTPLNMTQIPGNITRVTLPRNPAYSEYKIGILQTIRQMLQQLQPAMELNFPIQLTEKHWNFVRNIVNTCNSRVKTKIDPSHLADICDKIVDTIAETDYIVTACWGDTKQNILFILSKNTYQATDFDGKVWCCVISFHSGNLPQKTDGQTVAVNKSTIRNDSEETHMDRREFRYYALAQILEFCQESNVTIDKNSRQSTVCKDILLKCSILKKQRSYVSDTIGRLNNRSRASSECQHEISLFEEVKANMEGYTLAVEFPLKNNDEHFKVMRLRKIFCNISKALDKSSGKAKIDFQSTELINKMTNNQKETDSHNILKDIKVTIENAIPKSNETVKNMRKSVTNHEQDHDFDNKKAQNVTKNVENINTRVYVKARRRTTFTSDTFDEKCLFENLKSPQSSHITGYEIDNCICCPADNVDPELTYKDVEMTEYNKDKQTVEYIIIDNENIEMKNTTDTGTSIVNENNNKMLEENDTTSAKNDIINDNIIVNENDKTNGVETSHSQQIFADNGNKNYMVASTKKDKTTVIQNDSLKDTEKNYENDNETNKEDTQDIDTNTSMIAAKFDIDTLQNLTSLDIKTFVEQMRSDLVMLNLTDVNTNDSENQESINPNSNQIGKRQRSNVATPDRKCKKYKYDFIKKISITPLNYPLSKMTNKMAAEIQKSILTSMETTEELPLLKCHGIQDGALLYSCHTEKSFNLIKNVIKTHDLQVTVLQETEIQRHKMAIRINTFIKENVETILNRLESYNLGLKTKDWEIINKHQSSDNIVIYANIDNSSYEVIVKEKFTLYAGTDEARFSVEWA